MTWDTLPTRIVRLLEEDPVTVQAALNALRDPAVASVSWETARGSRVRIGKIGPRETWWEETCRGVGDAAGLVWRSEEMQVALWYVAAYALLYLAFSLL